VDLKILWIWKVSWHAFPKPDPPSTSSAFLGRKNQEADALANKAAAMPISPILRFFLLPLSRQFSWWHDSRHEILATSKKLHMMVEQRV
jgi:hypothetical protein